MPRPLWDTGHGVEFEVLADTMIAPPPMHDRELFIAEVRTRLHAAGIGVPDVIERVMPESEIRFVLAVANVVRHQIAGEVDVVGAFCDRISWHRREVAVTAYWGLRCQVSMAAALHLLPGVLSEIVHDERFRGGVMDMATAREIGRRHGKA